MKALLVYPEFPITYWGFQYGLPLVGRKSALPPLGLLSLAALLPKDWELRLVDLNAAPLGERDLVWADVVLTGGMRVQSESLHEILARAKRAGKRSVVGGPAPTTAPGEYEDADIVFCGEAEGRIQELVAALESPGRVTLKPAAGSPPALQSVPAPRYDLIRFSDYASMSVQYSRGCPFQCEFCDIIEIFGRIPRVKTAPQILGELDALYARGYRGSLFFVDDNFIGNKGQVKKLLPEIERWQKERDFPFEFYTEASVNLAADADLVRAMTLAGFNAVFLGIETPSPESLKAAKKNQNLSCDLAEAVESLSRSGLEVLGGFIVGMDLDTPASFELQRSFIENSPIALSMVGLLMALPGTGLWRRLEKEGRLRHSSGGDQFARPNFVPKMDEEALLQGYADLMAALYRPKAYYARCRRHLDLVAEALPRGKAGRKPVGISEILTLLRTSLFVGLSPRYGFHYWRLLFHALRRSPRHFAWAVSHAVQGAHFIRYTRSDLLPRIECSLEEVRRERELIPAKLGEPAPSLTPAFGCPSPNSGRGAGHATVGFPPLPALGEGARG